MTAVTHIHQQMHMIDVKPQIMHVYKLSYMLGDGSLSEDVKLTHPLYICNVKINYFSLLRVSLKTCNYVAKKLVCFKKPGFKIMVLPAPLNVTMSP